MHGRLAALEPDSPLARVLDAIAVPTREENLVLVARTQAGDAEARDELVVRNLRLVVSIAARYRPRTLTLAELVAEGVTGLLRAAEMFDGRHPSAFSTYATHWIRQRVSIAWRDHDAVVRIPRHIRNRTPLVRASLDAQMDSLDDGTPETLADRLHADAPSPEDLAARIEAVERLQAALQRLPECERIVLEQRFGLDGGEPRTLGEVGKGLGFTGERARQLEARALHRLREWHGVSGDVPRLRRERVQVRRTPTGPARRALNARRAAAGTEAACQ